MKNKMPRQGKSDKENIEPEDNSLSAKTKKRLILTVISAIMCALLMVLTKGERGIGWFIFSLILIW